MLKVSEARFEEAFKSMEDKIEYIREDVKYLRHRLDGAVWKIIGIGAGSGALGFVVALVASKMLV